MKKHKLFSLVSFSFLLILLGTSIVPAKASATTAPTIDVWWPTDSVYVQGVQPFKALLQNNNLDQYQMFWQVDNGNAVQMYDSYTDYPHKEAIVDVTNWNWKGKGPYIITLIAKDYRGNTLSTATRTIYISGATQTTTQTNIISNTISNTTSLVSSLVTTVPTNPLANIKLYVNPNSSAKNQAIAWQSTRPEDVALMTKLANQPQAIWLGGWSSDKDIQTRITSAITDAKKQNAVPVFVAYNIPQRDCGSYSAGGANNPDGYRTWIQSVANTIGNNKAVVILEPDAIAQSGCLSATDQATRFTLLNNAVTTFKAHSGTIVYIDAGHSGWIDANKMAADLVKAGIASADGFSLNVSNFNTTSDNTTYGTSISDALKKLGVRSSSGTHFVTDTSRNGNGSNGEWCNPSGRALGSIPTISTGNPLVDAYLWIKTPGESDGSCNGGPAAGVWWPEYALDITKRSQ